VDRHHVRWETIPEIPEKNVVTQMLLVSKTSVIYSYVYTKATFAQEADLTLEFNLNSILNSVISKHSLHFKRLLNIKLKFYEVILRPCCASLILLNCAQLGTKRPEKVSVFFRSVTHQIINWFPLQIQIACPMDKIAALSPQFLCLAMVVTNICLSVKVL
jgi:hypothetical protein